MFCMGWRRVELRSIMPPVARRSSTTSCHCAMLRARQQVYQGLGSSKR